MSDLDVFRGFLADGDSALLAPAGDAGALADALVRVARDPALAERLRARRPRRSPPRHTWARVAEAHEAVYRDFLQRALMAEGLEVTARWRGGYRADVEARGHTVAVDEPAEHGGGDDGLHAHRAVLRRARELLLPRRRRTSPASARSSVPGARRARRAPSAPGASCATRASASRCAADVDDELLDALIERARPFCWVSNTLAAGVEVEYGRLT